MASNTVDLNFADGSYTFALPLPRIDELQRKCREASGEPSGIGRIYARVMKGQVELANGKLVLVPGSAEFYACDIIETIRQGLIGGAKGEVDGQEVKVSPSRANQLVENYVLTRPMIENWSLAASILIAVIQGFDPPKKD